jgi:chorismate lyase/3-hydroxybenzoate synthase
MSSRPYNFARPSPPADLAGWPPPRWATALFTAADRRPGTDDGRLAVAVAATPAASLVSARVRGVDGMSPVEVEQATADAYAAVADRLGGLPAGNPVRFWNYIPNIHRPSGTRADGQLLDRYMMFNAGRYAACRQWLGGEDAFPRALATASGVGHDGADLVVHALAANHPGVAVENPRQVPAYRYSGRYGPRPPCFARATRVADPATGRPTVLVGGTASVRGEASVHAGDLDAQLDETAENLAALLAAASGQPFDGGARSQPMAAPLAAFADVRVYYVRPDDLADLQAACVRVFPAADLEFVRADLCRQDLLVEIEGVARLD